MPLARNMGFRGLWKTPSGAGRARPTGPDQGLLALAGRGAGPGHMVPSMMRTLLNSR